MTAQQTLRELAVVHGLGDQRFPDSALILDRTKRLMTRLAWVEQECARLTLLLYAGKAS